MNRAIAYKLLSGSLNAARTQGYGFLLARVDQAETSDTVIANGEQIVVGIKVSWADREAGKLKVCATAYGSSMWMTQRLEESITVGPDGAPAC